MDNASILALIIALLIVVIAALYLIRNKDKRTEPNYRVFFTLGVVWLPIGIAINNPALLGLGAVFLAAGLLNRHKWKETPQWSELSPESRRNKMIAVVGVTLLLLAALALYTLAK